MAGDEMDVRRKFRPHLRDDRALGRADIGDDGAGFQRRRDRFRHFATKFMSPELQVSFGTTTRLEALWFHFRNGLAHGFAVCHGGFEENAGSYFAVKNHSGYDVLEVSPTRLLADLENGFTTYIKQLRADCPTGSFLAFDVEFTSVFIDGN